VEQHGAKRARDVINRCIEFSNDGKSGNALDLLDEFLAETIPHGAEWIECATGIPQFCLQRWTSHAESRGTPSYVSRIFLIMIMRCIIAKGPRSILSPIFGIEEPWKPADDQCPVEADVLIHFKEAMPSLNPSGVASD
jgi:hypothetical protein